MFTYKGQKQTDFENYFFISFGHETNSVMDCIKFSVTQYFCSILLILDM